MPVTNPNIYANFRTYKSFFMKRIEVTTAQNVTIEYRGAHFFERVLAWLLDIVIIVAATNILAGLLSVFTPPEWQYWVSILILSPIYLFYHLLFEMFSNGASPGKKVVSIRVVKLNNEQVSNYDYFMRWMFRLIDITFSSGLLAIISIVSSSRNQRIGDYLADTTVIKVERGGRFALNRVLELDTLKNYEPQYSEITAFSEKDMLTIKEVIDRNQKYPGEGAQKALELTLKKIEDNLGIQPTGEKIAFLKTLIKDYVALTR